MDAGRARRGRRRGGRSLLSPRTGGRHALEAPGDYPVLEIRHPITGAVMPRNMPAPVVSWKTNAAGGEEWVVAFKVGGASPLKPGQDTQAAPGGRTWWFEGVQPLWRPEERVWRQIKEAAGSGPIDVSVGAFGKGNHHLQARGTARFTLSRDTVDQPLFYREVNLPFAEAVKDPIEDSLAVRGALTGAHAAGGPGESAGVRQLPFLRPQRRVSGDGRGLRQQQGLLCHHADRRRRCGWPPATSSAWDDYRREDGQQTFGLLSQISPDGRYVVSTVKDRSVFVPRPESGVFATLLSAQRHHGGL